jgi:hypothetical protein
MFLATIAQQFPPAFGDQTLIPLHGCPLLENAVNGALIVGLNP